MKAIRQGISPINGDVVVVGTNSTFVDLLPDGTTLLQKPWPRVNWLGTIVQLLKPGMPVIAAE